MRGLQTSMALLLTAAVALAEPPEVPAVLPAKVGEPTVLLFTLPDGSKIGQFQAFDPAKCFVARMWADNANVHNYMIFPKEPGEYRIVWWTAGEVRGTQTVIDARGGVTPVPPGPTPPTPVPPGPTPTPTPVTSFHVMLIRETGTNLTAAQNSVFHGITVERFLTERTTRDGQSAGWRRHDKDDPTVGDTATMNALWSAAKGALTPNTVLPCVAIAVNGKITLEPLPATPDAAIALFKKYIGE